jgi:hypothetical protein
MTLLTIALLLLLQAQPATVEGIVTKPGGVEPLPGARVTLSSGPGRTQQLSATTEEDGRFTLRNIPPGDYTVSANAPRYGSATFGQRRPGGPGSIISVAAGQALSGLKISVFPTGTIAGRITGRNGEPVVRGSVQAFQYVYSEGKRTLTSVRSATTNDLGEFRLFGLPAGQYFVSATLGTGLSITPNGIFFETSNAAETSRPNLIAQDSFIGTAIIRRLQDDGTFQEETWVPTYYPGTTVPRDATPVEVSGGATMNGVNITISPTPVRKISGQVIGPPGVPASVSLNVVGASSHGTVSLVATGSSFEFKGIKPGSYVLSASARMVGGFDPNGFRVQGPSYSSTVVPVEVGNRDVDGIRITLVPTFQLRGRVILENPGGQTAESNPFASLAITLTQGSIELPMTTFRPQATGAFVVENVSAGEYQIQLEMPTVLQDQTSDSRPFYLKSARLGPKDVTSGVSITESTQDSLEIVLTRESGTLEGLVTDPGRGGANGATVVLVPAIARKNSKLYKSAVTDTSGRFRLQGIATGDYLVFAWNDVETGAWQNADFLRPFEARGLRVRVSAGGQQDIQVQLISVP